ncbi:hypothetical protein [Algivirga pacifica]|uniref:Uncharacterized protein n=1 Tax=Algivirga pacifica TaxID=1162670 RepID=A0ABP9D406_9BACT
MQRIHNFQIPVMGIGFTIDTPIKVAAYGMDSVISLVDDELAEKVGQYHAKEWGIDFPVVDKNEKDLRALRFTNYLNLVQEIVQRKMEQVVTTATGREQYIAYLQESHPVRQAYETMVKRGAEENELCDWARENLKAGSIDVNIMTKVDKENFHKNTLLPVEYNDAHAALRGYANSNLRSSLILSAGMNPRLFSYMEKHEDFYPNEKGEIKKKIVLKVSDYRSALVQGKVLAKKGIWVSEYRIESGLNCGGHAFATDGLLMGPILQEFKEGREALKETTFEMLNKSLEQKEMPTCTVAPSMRITAQGGVGTFEEHSFLMDHYGLDAIGWGTPFLLVPEVTNVDDKTMALLLKAKEKDLYLSGISPLGVPFNTVRGNSMDVLKAERIMAGKPGSPCPKKYVQLNKEFGEKAICIASRTYQNKKQKELEAAGFSEEALEAEMAKMTEKSCICLGLGTSALLVNGIEHKVEGEEISVCPGPNMAYYTQKMTLAQMVDHIYGRANVIGREDRPNFLVKEISLYIDYLKKQAAQEVQPLNAKRKKYYRTYHQNMLKGIAYYLAFLSEEQIYFQQKVEQITEQLHQYEKELNEIYDSVTNIEEEVVLC